MFCPFKDKTDDVYTYLQAHFKIEYGGEVNKYLGIEFERSPYAARSDQSINNPHTSLHTYAKTYQKLHGRIYT